MLCSSDRCIYIYRHIYPTIMQGISVCLFANSSFNSHVIDVKLASPPQWHPWSVLRGVALCFRSYFENSNGTVLSAVLERRHLNDTFAEEYGSVGRVIQLVYIICDPTRNRNNEFIL